MSLGNTSRRSQVGSFLCLMLPPGWLTDQHAGTACSGRGRSCPTTWRGTGSSFSPSCDIPSSGEQGCHGFWEEKKWARVNSLNYWYLNTSSSSFHPFSSLFLFFFLISGWSLHLRTSWCTGRTRPTSVWPTGSVTKPCEYAQSDAHLRSLNCTFCILDVSLTDQKKSGLKDTHKRTLKSV